MDKWRSNKFLRTALFALVAFLAFSGVLGKGLDSIPYIRAKNQEIVKYLDNWTQKSVVTFAAANLASAGLSVIEDSELQAAPAGMGPSFAFGDAVRPANEMVAKVASVALASAISLGIQRVLIDVGASVGLKWFLMLSMACLALAEWVDWSNLRQLAQRLLVLALVATFAIPGAVLLTGSIGDRFTKGAYVEAQEQLKLLDAEVKQINLKNISRIGDRLKATADAYVDLAVNYIVVFIVQTMLMPILILWGLVKLLGQVLNPASAAAMEARLLAAIRGREKSGDTSVPTPKAAAEA